MESEFEPIGEWRVERVSGLLPPFGISKSIGRSGGVTRVAGVPVAPFRLVHRTLIYALLPVRDELSRLPDGSWEGRGLVLGRQFCRFRLRRR
ncbi:MAG: hypothetical protein ACXVYV_08815 [Gaiellales bacterium]